MKMQHTLKGSFVSINPYEYTSDPIFIDTETDAQNGLKPLTY